MIAQWYPAPKKTVITGQLPEIGGSPDTYGAKRLGLDVAEYRNRQEIIAAANRECQSRGWREGTVLFPKKHEDWVFLGAVTIIGFARTPGEYGHTEWDEKHPKIIRARLNDKATSFVDVSPDFLSDTQPLQPQKTEEPAC